MSDIAKSANTAVKPGKFPHKSTPKKVLFARMLTIALGAILMSIGLELFLVPNQILDGGVVGVSLLQKHIYIS